MHKDTNLKNKSIAILSRGGNHLIERHIKRNHPRIDIEEVRPQIVTMEHASAPKEIRKFASDSCTPKRMTKGVENSYKF